MELEISPEPSAQERDALVRALEQSADRSGDPYGSVWRLAGLLENVDSGDEAPRFAPDTVSPRSRRGASRA